MYTDKQSYRAKLVEEVMNYRFHASSLGELMAWKEEPLTPNQQETLKKLEEKINNGKELTLRQKETITDLYEKLRRGPSLTSGGKTALRKILKEIIFGYKYEVYAKYANKGTYVEDDSIDLYNRYKGTNYTKNDKRFTNDILTGEPDIIDEDNKLIIDIKSSWTADTFPLFDNKLPSTRYEWQLKAYMYLLGYTEGKVVYVLTNTPEFIVQDELYKWANAHNVLDIPDEVEEYIRSKHNYDDVPLPLRIKEFSVFLYPEDIKKIEKTDKLARNFLIQEIDRIIETLK